MEEVSKIPKERTFGWIMNRLNCTLMQNKARAINLKVAGINSHITRADASRRAFSAGFINTHMRYRSRGYGPRGV